MKKENNSDKISKHKFYFETPLYDVIKGDELNDKDIFGGDVDAYNSVRDHETTYRIETSPISDSIPSDYCGYFKVTLICKRNGKDKLRFFIYSDDEIIIKIGQLPSLVDIQFAKIDKKYNKFLSKELLKEFKRAIELATHNVGIGSFVYLRRIFENLIYDAFDEHKQDINITKKDFFKKRIEEKINVLKNYLPSQLIEMKSIYAILSKGIHELDEQTCLNYFSALKLSIELILDQKIMLDIKNKKDKKVKRQIQVINKKMSE